MANFKNTKSSTKKVFIDYIPAELKQTNGSDWRVVYYCKVPGKEEMKRFRKRVPKLNSKKDRERLAKQICLNINNDLKSGWSPFYDVNTKNEYRLFLDTLNQFSKQTERKLKDKLIRPDSLRAYTSYLNNVKEYMLKNNMENMLSVEFTRDFVVTFLDHIYFERKRSARTHNNYLGFLNLIGVFMEDRKYIPQNPVFKIPKRKVNKKKREVLPHWLRDDIINYCSLKSKAYLTLCLTTYFCFVRRTELTKLLVKHVNIKEGTIFVPGDASKNGRDGTVTITKKLMPLLRNHIDGSNNSFYLFSENNYLPGERQLQPKKISDEWAEMRRKMNLDSKYQFYSLKDTGITNLLLMGVPAKKVRDQARHYDIRVTESYISRNEKADEELRTIDFEF